MKTLIKNATLVNENELQVADLLIEDERISRIGANLNPKGDYQVIDATGKYLLLVLPTRLLSLPKVGRLWLEELRLSLNNPTPYPKR